MHAPQRDRGDDQQCDGRHPGDDGRIEAEHYAGIRGHLAGEKIRQTYHDA